MGRYLVTGVSRGIGRGVASRLSAGGHSVVGVVRPGSAAVEPSVESVIEADLGDHASLRSALGDVVDLPLDGLVHCAGLVRAGRLAAACAADFTDLFAVNVTGAFELTRLLLPALRLSRGTVVFVNSGSGQNAREPLGAYASSKFALRGYADALRAAEPSVRVCTLYPGRTATDMQREVRVAESASFVESDYLAVSTVAGVIETMLMLPSDGVLTEVTLRPWSS